MKEFAAALYRGTQVLLLAAGLATASTQRAFAQTSLLNVSFDPTREIYAEINPLFVADWKKSPVKMSPSACGRAAQARMRGRRAPKAKAFVKRSRSPTVRLSGEGSRRAPAPLSARGRYSDGTRINRSPAMTLREQGA